MSHNGLQRMLLSTQDLSRRARRSLPPGGPQGGEKEKELFVQISLGCHFLLVKVHPTEGNSFVLLSCVLPSCGGSPGS